MLKRYQRVIGNLFRLVDIGVIGSAWIIAFWLRFDVRYIEVTKGFPSFETYAALLPLIMFLWTIVFSTMNVYSSKRMLRRTQEVFLILKAHCIAVLLFISITFIFTEYRYSRGVILAFAGIGGFLLIAFRLTLRNILRALRKRGYNLRHVLIVGNGTLVEDVSYLIHRFPELGLRAVGVAAPSDSEKNVFYKTPKIGTYEQIPEIVQKHLIDQVIIALSRQDYSKMDQIVRSLKKQTAEIRIIPDIHEYVTLGCEIEDFNGHPMVSVTHSPLQGWATLLKRWTDIVISVIALLLLSPILILISVLVKLSSPGPIFYSQERMGLDGKTFKMYKFRSMKQDAETKTGAVWAQANDDRRTWIGGFLRSSSLDELPQLWNVLRGDMSIVGPRPERPIFVEKFKDEIPSYMLRHKVKSGITGWAQVNGWRGNTSLERRIECDLYYIRNWSYLLDLKIIFMTFWKGFINKNAY